MAEERCTNEALADPEIPPQESSKSNLLLKELKKDLEVNLSAALESVLNEKANFPEKERNQRRFSPETSPRPSCDSLPGICEKPDVCNDVPSLPSPILPNLEISETDTEETGTLYSVDSKLPTTLDPIPELTTTPDVSIIESATRNTMVPLVVEIQPTPDASLLNEVDKSTIRSEMDLISAEDYLSTEKENLVFTGEIDKTPAMLSSEKLSDITTNETTSLVSSELYISTKCSTENTGESKQEAFRELASNQTLIALQKIMPPNLGEDAKHIFKAATEKLLKDPKVESQILDDLSAESSIDVELASAKSADADILPLTGVETTVEAVERVTCKVEEKSDIVTPARLNSPPVRVDSLETDIDVVDFHSTEVHSDHIEFHASLTNENEMPASPDEVLLTPAEFNQGEVQTTLAEANINMTEVHSNLSEGRAALSEIPTSTTERSSSTKLQAISTEVRSNAAEVHASMAKVHFSLSESPARSTEEVRTYPTEAHSLTEFRAGHEEVPNYADDSPADSQPEPTPTLPESQVPKLEGSLEDVLKDISEEAQASPALLSKDKPSEVSIRQSEGSKIPAKKQTSKTSTKTGKPVMKTAARAPSNPLNTRQSEQSIAATSSASATSALSPISEKGIKQIKSPRPASATSVRGLHGDLSSSVLGAMALTLTGPQRVAAARAAAAAAGMKRKVSSLASPSIHLDCARSPREKLSITSTNSVVPAVSATSNSTVQRRTSGAPAQPATSTQHSNVSRRGLLNDGHRTSGYGPSSQLVILGSHQKLKSLTDIKSLEDTYSAVLKSFVDAKKEIHHKTKLAIEMFSEVERLRHIASTKYGKDLPLTESISSLTEVAEATQPVTGGGEQIFSDEDNRTVAVVEALLKALTSQRTSLLNEAVQHHANLLACCSEATGDDGSPMLCSEKEFADQLPGRISEVASAEQSRGAEVLQVLRTSLSDLEETKAWIRDLRSQLELLNQENSTLTASLAECTKELEESRSESGKITARKVAAEKEIKIIRMRLKEVEAKASAEEHMGKDLSNQVRSLEEKLRSKDLAIEQRAKEVEKKMKERAAKENEENQRRMAEMLKEHQHNESEMKASSQKLEKSLANVKQLLETRTAEKEKVDEELKVISGKLTRLTMYRPGSAEISQSKRDDVLQRLHAMIDDEDISTGPKLREELQALADHLNEWQEKNNLITDKESEIHRLKESQNERGDSKLSREDFLELQQTLTMVASHNQNLELELSKMQQAAAKRDRVMSEQEKVLVIRDQLIALLQSSNHPAGNVDAGSANANTVAIQKRMLELQTTVERQTVRIKALETQLAKTEEHQDGLQNLRTRYERRIAQLEHALNDHRVAHRSENITKLRTLLQNNLGQ